MFYVNVSGTGVSVYTSKEMAPRGSIEVVDFPQQTKENQMLCFDEKSKTLYWKDCPEQIPIQEPEKPIDLIAENKLLKAQVKALSDHNDFMDDCVAEMATKVYAV